MNNSEFSNIDIDELLNGFLDGELDARHHTEVQRLIEHDEQIAKRFQKLRNCKQLVSSLPYAEAPQGTLENIKAALERAPLHAPTHKFDRHKGAKHLLFRRLVAAAAMIGLVAVLGAVIYSIVAPEPAVDESLTAQEWLQLDTRPIPKIKVADAEASIDMAAFRGKLVLKTNRLPEVAAFLNDAVERCIPSDERTGTLAELKLTCSRQNLTSLMAELSNIWDKFDSATLFVETDRPETQVAVAAVVPEQILEIANQDGPETQIKAAQYFAALNNMTPGKDTMLAEDGTPLTIPKPVLTSGADRPQTDGEKQAEAERKIVLTIVVTDNEQ